MKLQINNTDKEKFEKAGAKVIDIKDPAMTNEMTYVIIDNRDIATMAKIIQMCSPVKKNHA